MKINISLHNIITPALLNSFFLHDKIVELPHQLEFLFFYVGAGMGFSFYIIWLFVVYGDLAPVIIIAIQTGMCSLDILALLLALTVTPQVKTVALLPYLFAYSVFYQPFMRSVRSVAYIREWVFEMSYFDKYVPGKVHRRMGQ